MKLYGVVHFLLDPLRKERKNVLERLSFAGEFDELELMMKNSWYSSLVSINFNMKSWIMIGSSITNSMPRDSSWWLPAHTCTPTRRESLLFYYYCYILFILLLVLFSSAAPPYYVYSPNEGECAIKIKSIWCPTPERYQLNFQRLLAWIILLFIVFFSSRPVPTHSIVPFFLDYFT